MALTTIDQVLQIPGLNNIASVPTAWLTSLIGAADSAIKHHCKQNLEYQSQVEYYSGNLQRDIIARQFPVIQGTTQIAAGSNGAVLPQSTINVASTAGFPTGAGPNGILPTIGIQTSLSSWTPVTYTGTTSTAFTGCSGGTGTLSSAATLNQVYMPVVFYDPLGYYGQNPAGFGVGSQMVMGRQYVVVVDDGGMVSNRGLIRRVAGYGGPGDGGLWFGDWYGGYPNLLAAGKLAASRGPVWPGCEGGLRVNYSSGFLPGQIPPDLQYACSMLVLTMVRNQPAGGLLSNESLGSYAYSILSQSADFPELSGIPTTLSHYRESAW